MCIRTHIKYLELTPRQIVKRLFVTKFCPFAQAFASCRCKKEKKKRTRAAQDWGSRSICKNVQVSADPVAFTFDFTSFLLHIYKREVSKLSFGERITTLTLMVSEISAKMTFDLELSQGHTYKLDFQYLTTSQHTLQKKFLKSIHKQQIDNCGHTHTQTVTHNLNPIDPPPPSSG